jgi:hypothetical protein
LPNSPGSIQEHADAGLPITTSRQPTRSELSSARSCDASTKETKQERMRGYLRKYHQNPANHHKHHAHGIVHEALKSGRLIRAEACEKCGHPTVEAHHESYSKPLEVNWLCRDCHKALHRKTHCLRGHPLTPDNVYMRPNGERFCSQCAIDRVQKYRNAKKKDR